MKNNGEELEHDESMITGNVHTRDEDNPKKQTHSLNHRYNNTNAVNIGYFGS